jgi:hypothetical protein
VNDGQSEPSPVLAFGRTERLGLAIVGAVAVLAVLGLTIQAVLAAPQRGLPVDDEPIQVDLNRADWYELGLVPGLGQVMSQRIVDYRDRHGPYNSVDELLHVKDEGITGIGKIRLEAIRPYLKLTPPSHQLSPNELGVP